MSQPQLAIRRDDPSNVEPPSPSQLAGQASPVAAAQSPNRPRSFWGNFLFKNLLEWRMADKCLLVAGIVGGTVLWYAAAEYYVIRNPGVAPYLDPTYLRISLKVHQWELVVWPAIAALSIALRRKHPESQWLAHLTIQAFVITIVIFSYLLGHLTSMFAGIVAIGGVSVGYVLFGSTVTLPAVVVYFLLSGALTVGEQLGLIAYAPLLAEAPFASGQLSRWWLVTLAGPTFGIFLLFIGWIYVLIESWRDREADLARTSEQLSKATDVISRYVASQLAQQILTGDYEALGKHDRRKLTLFFSDIEDFAEIADRVEPEDLSEVLNEYLSEMATIGDRYGGTIDKFGGDSVMIFFGAPVAMGDEEQGVRAVRMAVDMQNRMTELREKWLAHGFERPFHVRIGINTGRASIGNFGSKGRMDYTAIGRQVNLAARLQTHSEPDRILISHSTWALVQDEFDCKERGEVTVKGMRDPVKVYEVVGPRHDRASTS